MFRLTKLVLMAALVLAGPAQLLADVTGKILGTVTDPSGAVVVGATVTLHNGLTGYERTVKSDAAGYQFLAVPIGDGYEVRVESQGFEKAVQTGITLLVNQDFRADFALHVGATAQTVEASAAVMQVETTSNQLGDVIQDSKIGEMPLNGRSYIDLVGLQAGVIPNTSPAAYYSLSSVPVSGDGMSGMVSVNGARESGNGFNVNGGDVENDFDNGTAVVPVLDSIQEFRLLSNTADAEYGRVTGAVINVVTKSGTNQIHGDAFEFLRNDALDAKDYFASKNSLQQNQFGGTLGGHILRNRLFYFGDYQGTIQSTGGAGHNVAVPSDDMRGGDFSNAANIGFRSFGYDPDSSTTYYVRGGGATGGSESMDQRLTRLLGYTVNNDEPYWVPGCTTSDVTQSDSCVFPGQVIPKAAWSPAATGTLKFFAEPTPGATNSLNQPIYQSSAIHTLNDEKMGTRVDFNTRNTGDWAFYYHYDNATVKNPFGGGSMPGFPSALAERAQQILVSDTKSFGSTAVNELRLNYTRNKLVSGSMLSGFGKVTDWGFLGTGLGIIPAYPADEGVPNARLSSGPSFAGTQPNGTYGNTYQLLDGFSKIVGRHTFKVGGDVRKLQLNENGIYHNNGYFTFNGSETGNDFADYLLGAPNYFEQATPAIMDDRSTYVATYGQDSIRFRPNLTVNAGLRWEYGTPWAEQKGRVETFVPGLQSTIFPDSPTGWVFPGDPGIAPGMWPTRHNQVGPRLGIAYSPSATDGFLGKLFGGPGKTSIRAASGIYYAALLQAEDNWFTGYAPFFNTFAASKLDYYEAPFAARQGADIGQKFPFIPPAKGSDVSFDNFLPLASVQAAWTRNKVETEQQWNLSIQREIPKFAILTLGYVGNEGHHLLGLTEANPGNAQLCMSLMDPTQMDPNSPLCGPGSEDQIFTRLDGTKVYGTRPYSVTSGRDLANGTLDFGNFPWIETWHNSKYNAAQVSLQRDTGSFRFLAAYTWSKIIDDGSGWNDSWMNPFNHRQTRAISAYDVPQNFVVSYTYDLPVGALFHSNNRWVSGWQFAGITRFEDGFPVTLFTFQDHSLCGTYLGCDFLKYDGSGVKFYNPRSGDRSTVLPFFSGNFTTNDIGTSGNAPRRFFLGPNSFNTDFSLHKITHITEGSTVEIRMEYFDVFNRTPFGMPDGTVDDGTFGYITGASGDNRVGQFGAKFTF